MEEVAAEEAAEEVNDVTQTGDKATDKNLKEIDAAAATAKKEAQSAVDKETSEALKKQEAEMNDLEKKAEEDAEKLREDSAEKQQQELNDVKDAAELDARERAQHAVDEVKKGTKEDSRKVLLKADDFKKEAARLQKVAMDSSKAAMAAAAAAKKAAESLPQEEAAKAIEYAKHAQDMAKGLQAQARYVKRVSKLAGITAMHAVEAATEAQKYIKQANEIANKAVAQAAANAKLLGELRAKVNKAADDAVQISGRSRNAVYAATQANYTIAETKRMIAQKEAAKKLEEEEAMAKSGAAQPVLIAMGTFLGQHEQ